MQFSKDNLSDILFSAIPNRFQDFDPSDFEDFIAQLYRDMNYEVEQTKYSGDFGADLVVSDKSVKTVIQVKRYAESNRVGVQDINQVIGSKEYYKAQECALVTTSSFTVQAIELCNMANVKMTDWDGLLQNICDLYFGGRDYFTYYEDRLKPGYVQSETIVPGVKNSLSHLDYIFDFRITEFVPNMTTSERYAQDINGLLVDVTNKSSKNVPLYSYVPDFITPEYRQFSAVNCWGGCFLGGVVYAGSTVTMGYFFRPDQLVGRSVLKEGATLILAVSLDGTNVIRKFIKIKADDAIKFPVEVIIPKVEVIIPEIDTKSRTGLCFVATVLYGKDSFEYNELTYFRDHVLLTHGLGCRFIDIYYKVGPILARLANEHRVVRCFALVVVGTLSRIVAHLNSSNRRKSV